MCAHNPHIPDARTHRSDTAFSLLARPKVDAALEAACQLHCEAKLAGHQGDATFIDGAYDKLLYASAFDHSFPLRLLPPYLSCTAPAISAFVQARECSVRSAMRSHPCHRAPRR